MKSDHVTKFGRELILSPPHDVFTEHCEQSDHPQDCMKIDIPGHGAANVVTWSDFIAVFCIEMLHTRPVIA